MKHFKILLRVGRRISFRKKEFILYKRFIKPVIIMLSVTAAIILILMAISESGNQKGYRASMQGDYETAFSKWSHLAEKGDIEAQFNLGALYNNGDGVSKNMNRAVELYQKGGRTRGCPRSI